MSVTIPLPHAPWLRYDPADVPALIASCAMGPTAGALVVLLRNVLRFLLVNPDLVGLTMNTIASAAFVVVVGTIYGRTLTRLGAAVAIVAGATTAAVLMVWVNGIVLPLYLGLPRAKLMGVLLATVLPFNLVKGLANGCLVFLLYKSISPHLPRHRHPGQVLLRG